MKQITQIFLEGESPTLTYVFPIIEVVRVLDSQSRSPSSKTAGWLQGQVIFLFFRG